MGELDLIGRTLGGYRVGELLGLGAFGWVYRASQVSLDRPVALKVLDPVVVRNPDAARRFDREGRSAAALDEVLARGPLAPADLLALLRRIGPALDHAHAAGIVHRDVKPANILLEQGDPRRAWLGDFGIAVSVRAAGALSTAALGTAFYMAPEQVEPSKVVPASDQYSLACVAYEALTGRRPFAGDDVMAVLMSHRVDPVPPTGSAALDSVLGKALAKHPGQRYPTVAAFVHAVNGALRSSAGSPPATVAVAGSRPARGRARWVVGVGPVCCSLPAQSTGRVRRGTRFRKKWRQDTASGPVSRFVHSGEQVLIVGSDQPGGDVDPVADLRRLYQCTGEVQKFPLAGGRAASCDTTGKHATVVAVGRTAVRFTFSSAVSSADRDQVLASLTVTGSQQ